MRSWRFRTMGPLAALVASMCSIGCTGGGEPRVAPASEARPYVGGPVVTEADSARRFGGTPMAAGGALGGGVLPGAGTAPQGETFQYTLPDGWERLAPTSMRSVNLRVARAPQAECTLTMLAGDGGGLAANIDRWLGQMGLAPLREGELAALPRELLLGREATRVDFAGDYTGMMGGGGTDFRMVGLLAVAPEGSAFLKFVGPAAIVAEELAAFDAIASSLRAAAPGAPAASSTPTGGASSEVVRWTAPASWTQGPARMMREVTFTTDPQKLVECYISVLGGDGGGIRANFDRWRGQMSQPPLTAEELAALERTPSLGTTALLIEITGQFEGMSGETHEDALMLGAVASLGGQTVFVKLVGPSAAAALERENFRAFVNSLEPAR